MPRSSLTFRVGAVLASAFLPAAGPAAAAVSGTLSLTNDYLFRGLSQTNQKPALQGGVEYAADSGIYAGVWGSNISWLSDYSSAALPISSSVELDGYLGWRGDIADGFKLDAGVYTYYYPGDYPSGFVRPYTTEVYLGASWGPATLKYSHALTNLFGFAESDGSGYLRTATGSSASRAVSTAAGRWPPRMPTRTRSAASTPTPSATTSAVRPAP